MSSLVQHDCFKGRLSVVVPSRNEELNIPPLIENLQACYGEYIKEIIIVDDNSRDGTAKVTKILTEEDPRIRLVQRSMPNGVGRACEMALQRRKGILSSLWIATFNIFYLSSQVYSMLLPKVQMWQ